MSTSRYSHTMRLDILIDINGLYEVLYMVASECEDRAVMAGRYNDKDDPDYIHANALAEKWRKAGELVAETAIRLKQRMPDVPGITTKPLNER